MPLDTKVKISVFPDPAVNVGAVPPGHLKFAFQANVLVPVLWVTERI